MDTTNTNPNLNDLLKQALNKCPGAKSRIQTIFNYHYDAILRDIQAEVQNVPNKDEILDLVTEVLEVNWPIAEDELL